MSEKPEVVPAKGTPKNRIVHPRTELRWPPFHSNLLSEEFLDEVKAVFDEMLGRLYYGADKRKGWATAEPWKELTEHECRTCIRDAIAKGKLIDAMNYLMFAHLNCHKILTLRNQSLDSQMRDQLANALGVTGRSWDEMLDLVVKMRREGIEKTDAFAQVATALQMGTETPPKHLANIVESQLKARNTVTIKSEPAPDLFPEQRIQIKNGTAKWTGMTPPEGVEGELKWSLTTTQDEDEAPGRKVGLSPAMAAPYGVKAPKKQQQYELTMEADESGFPSVMFRFKNKKDRDDYLPLLRTFLGALEQAAYGKGRERHANDLPFVEQPILTMAHMLDSDAGLAQQVIKKTVEARSLPTKQARINELRGTLVYAAAMILFEEMYGRADDPDDLNGAR